MSDEQEEPESNQTQVELQSREDARRFHQAKSAFLFFLDNEGEKADLREGSYELFIQACHEYEYIRDHGINRRAKSIREEDVSTEKDFES